MDTQPETTASSFVYNRIPTKVARKDFNRDIEPHLHRPKKGPKPKLSLYKIFNYILYVLHTGIQWEQLKTNRKELHYTNVYKWHNRWSKNGWSCTCPMRINIAGSPIDRYKSKKA
jgi:hypothetical protein